MQRIINSLTLGLAITVTSLYGSGAENRAQAQFGGYQEMTLDKIRRQQAADARQLGRGGPVGPVVPPRRPVINKHYYISPYYYGYPYDYGYPYGFGYNYGWVGPYAPGYGYYGWQNYSALPSTNILVQPQVQVNPPAVPPGQPVGNAQGQAMRNPAAGPGAAGVVAPDDEIARRVAALKPSNEPGRMRADTLISDGDREFAAQQYRRAASKYREAIGRAPDYATAHLRAGHAYTATGDYELAVTYFAMGFQLAGKIERDGFSLATLYRGNRLAQDQHLEALADAALRQPEQGGLLFLTGLMLHYDGKPLQARDYFRRAAQMPGRHQPYAAMFLPQAAAPNNAPPPAAAAQR